MSAAAGVVAPTGANAVFARSREDFRRNDDGDARVDVFSPMFGELVPTPLPDASDAPFQSSRFGLGRRRKRRSLEAMAVALEEVAALDDPVGEVVEIKTRPNGLRIGRMRSPLGVIGIIYESRPNVTADAGCLCVKSGNAVILRGGSEAFHSNMILARLMEDAGAAAKALDHAFGKNILNVLKNSDHGKYLTEIGFADDLAVCAEVDSVPIVPVLSGSVIRLRKDGKTFSKRT